MPDPAVVLNPYQAPEAPAGSTLGFDIPCLQCRYNLRGLSIPGRCPECGLETARSLDLSLLRFRTPKHLARLHRGANTVGCVLAVLFFSPCFLGSWSAALRMTGLPAAGVAWTFAAMSAGVAALWTWGWWSLTPIPCDSGSAQASTGRARAWTRRAGMAVFVTWCTTAFSYAATETLVRTLGFADPGATRVGSFVIVWLGVAALAVQFFASLVYMRRLGAQVPDKRLKRASPVLTAATLLAIALALVALLWAWAAPNAYDLPIALSLGAVLLGIATYLALVVLLFRLATKLKRSRRDAMGMRRAVAATRRAARSQPAPPPAPRA